MSEPGELARANEPSPILLVDDDERSLYSLRQILARPDVDIFCAGSGREVLREVLRRDFAVILLDVRMPELDGYETAALIRQRDKSQHIPLIFLTGVDKDIDHIFRGYSAGAVDYVFKPVDPVVLRAKVSVFLNLHRQSQKIHEQMIHTRQLLDENIRTRKANEAYVERLQHLSRQLMTVQDIERRNLARELHDEIGQCLGALNLNLQTLAKQLGSSKAQCSLVEDSIEILNNLVYQVRNMSLEMHPTMLEDFGLEATLQWYLEHLRERTGMAIDYRSDLKDATLSSDQVTTCYRIVQSALTNVMRHARASHVSVALELCKDNELVLTVADDGVGFDSDQASRKIQQCKSFGLTAMRERAFLIGGELEIHSQRRQGTIVRLRLPLRKTARRKTQKVSAA